MGTIVNFDEMENTPKEDLIAKYSGSRTFAPLQPPTPKNETTEKIEYGGLIEYTGAKRNNRFRVIDKNGTSYGCGYAYLIGWVFTPPAMLTINTSTHICTLEGRGLEEIDRALLDEKVKELREYNPLKHTLSEDTKTVIEKLEFISRFEDGGK
jgi:hypothetical protein